MRLLLGGAYFWEGAYYQSLISSLQQMRLLLSGAYYRGRLLQEVYGIPHEEYVTKFYKSFKKYLCDGVSHDVNKHILITK